MLPAQILLTWKSSKWANHSSAIPDYRHYTFKPKMQKIFILQENDGQQSYTLTAHCRKLSMLGKYETTKTKTILFIIFFFFPLWKHDLAPFQLGSNILSFRYSSKEALFYVSSVFLCKETDGSFFSVSANTLSTWIKSVLLKRPVIKHLEFAIH